MSILVTGQYEPQLPSIYLDVTAEDVVDDNDTVDDVIDDEELTSADRESSGGQAFLMIVVWRTLVGDVRGAVPSDIRQLWVWRWLLVCVVGLR